ncbi:MAG: SAM-dependent chlorinase/fluorinase [Chitinophagaceae bacterium]
MRAVFGDADVAIIEENPFAPIAGENSSIQGQIIFIDNFENVIVNITREQFEQRAKGKKF